VLVPISNWAAFGGSKEVIIWLPIDIIANTITALIAVRKQVIDDIYQVMGLSDIMRGATDPMETLGAQKLKSQYGSARIRDKQGEMVRVSRDTVEISAEIICDRFSLDTMMAMSQMDIPTEAAQQQKVAMMQQQLQTQLQQAQQQIMMAQQNPQMQQQAQQQPQLLQQLGQQIQVLTQKGQSDIQQEMQVPTQERIYQFLKDYRTTAFVLDIETDSTIQADEMQEKQMRGEFIGMLSQLIPQLVQLIGVEPQAAPFAGEVLKFAVAPFRVGRTMDGAIDDLVEVAQAKAGQGQQSPQQAEAQAKLQIEREKMQQQKAQDDADNQMKMLEIQNKNQQEQQKLQNEFQLALFEAQAKKEESNAKIQQILAKGQMDAQAHDMHITENEQKRELQTQTMQMKQQDAANRQADMAARRAQQDRSQLFKEQQAALRPVGGGARR
jgi:hypothetical protein